MPDSPMSIIDFHGLLDDVIPASPNSPENLGPGPDNTTKNVDGYYYHIKLDHLIKVRLPKLPSTYILRKLASFIGQNFSFEEHAKMTVGQCRKNKKKFSLLKKKFPLSF